MMEMIIRIMKRLIMNVIKTFSKKPKKQEVADLFILPSEKESFGLAALEAMACGVPVISSNTGGLPEVNIQGISGFLSDVGNVDEMAENALKILSSDEVLNNFKKQAIEAAMVYDTKKIVPMYERLYTKAIADKCHPKPQ